MPPLAGEDAIERVERLGVAGRLLQQPAQLVDRLIGLGQVLLEEARALREQQAPLLAAVGQLQLARVDLGQLAVRAARGVQLRERLQRVDVRRRRSPAPSPRRAPPGRAA